MTCYLQCASRSTYSIIFLLQTHHKLLFSDPQGYFSMAKARYAMGAQTVGALQYDTVMSALVHVRLNPETVSHDETVSPTEECFEFKVERIQPGKVDNSHTSQLEEAVREESHLRRRKPVSAEEHSVEDLRPAEEEEREVEKGVREGEPPKDPLKWFGILVPQSLRHSQQCFIQGIDLFSILATTSSTTVMHE